MKYFIDTEFLEGKQDKKIFGLKYGQTKPTIDLISIGIVAEDGREYYAISKDFNLKEAWNRYQLKVNKMYPMGPKNLKEYWIRENVLKPIFKDLYNKSLNDKEYIESNFFTHASGFTYNHMKSLINWYGLTNNEIAKGIRNFIYTETINEGGQILLGSFIPNVTPKPEFYAYYADYDWVGFCWLFGRMIDLPIGFPMYCKDLKQVSDNVYDERKKSYEAGGGKNFISKLSKHPDYPQQKNEHNALADARWNLELYKFLDKVKL